MEVTEGRNGLEFQITPAEKTQQGTGLVGVDGIVRQFLFINCYIFNLGNKMQLIQINPDHDRLEAKISVLKDFPSNLCLPAKLYTGSIIS